MKNEKSLFQFTNPYLVRIIFEETVNFDGDTDEDMTLITETDIKITGEQSALVTLLFRNDGNNLPFKVEIVMRSEFTWKDLKIGDEMLKKLLSVNAPALILSYIRPLVAMLTSNSRFPALNIPFIDMRLKQ